jgi:hypothetical protein
MAVPQFTGYRAPLLPLLALTAACAPGCVERTIRVTSEPAGAIVWLNDVEIGRTPVETDFTFYGTYDVRLNREGCEPIVTTREAKAPVHEWPGLDLVALALPFTFTNVVEWNFEMTPTPESIDPEAAAAALLERADEARQRYGAAPESPSPPQP